jgi:hypothetical protein
VTGSQLFASSSPIAAGVGSIAAAGVGMWGVEVLQAKDVGGRRRPPGRPDRC